MARATFTYDPTKIGEYGKDRMRFELGDTIVEGEGQAAALSDEEYEAVIAANPGKWKACEAGSHREHHATLLVRSGRKGRSLTLSLRQRYDSWKAMYDQLKKEVANCTVPSANPSAINGRALLLRRNAQQPIAGGTEKRGGRLV